MGRGNMSTKIDAKLLAETGNYVDPPNGKLWQRTACPFCGHARAVVNYDSDWFQCWSCGEKRSGYAEDQGSLAVVRYHRQIARAATKTKDKFGDWLNHMDQDDVENAARWFVWNYSEGEQGSGHDAGMLDTWETRYNAEKEPWRMDSLIQHVLDKDMLNWAEKVKGWKDAHKSNKDGYGQTVSLVVGSVGAVLGDATHGTDQGDKGQSVRGMVTEGIGYQLRKKRATNAMKYGRTDVYYRSEEPPGTRVAGKMNYGPLKRCELTRNGAGPIAGHCAWCDKSLGLPAKAPKTSTDVHQEHSDARKRFPYLTAKWVDEYTEAEIAKAFNVSVRTVKRKLHRETQILKDLRDQLSLAT